MLYTRKKFFSISPSLLALQILIVASVFLFTADSSYGATAEQNVNAVVFIDQGVSDWSILADGVLPGNKIVVLDEKHPVLEQMTESLQMIHQGGTAIESVHIVSHGKPGTLVFSSSEISEKTILANSSQLLHWNQLLTEHSTIYLYGCDVASEKSGEAFLTQLSELTGSSVASSSNRTGAYSLGGDWDLEITNGNINSAPPFSIQALADYSHTLVAAHTYGFGTSTGNGTPTLTETVDGVIVTVTSSTGGNVVISSGFVEPGVLGGSDTYTLAFSTAITITSFQIGEFMNLSAGENYVFNPSSGTTVTIADNAGALAGSVATFNPTDWIGVTSLVVSYAGSDNWRVGLDNIPFTISNIAPVLAGVDNTPTFTEAGSAVVLDGNATVSDNELDALNAAAGNYSGASLSLIRNGGANANDTFAIPSGGNLTVSGGPNGGGTITAGGNVMANITNVSDDDEITITFTDANGTIPTTALVNEVIQAITYANSSDSPAASVQVNYTFSDGTASDTNDSITVTITEVNDIPTLTTFTSVLDTTNEDTEVEITLAEFKAQGDEADVDGTVDGFVIKAVSTGSLKIGANSGAAAAFNAGVVDTVNAGNNAYWTPAGNANGPLNAFTAVAEDNDSAESASPIQAVVSVNPVNDAPTLDNTKTPVLGAINEDSGAPSGAVGT